MANKALYDQRAKSRQSAARTTVGHIYRQTFATFALVTRSFARVIALGVQSIVARLKLLALPAPRLTDIDKLHRAAARVRTAVA